jgi:putative photosynthetic complex assembly protein 2
VSTITTAILYTLFLWWFSTGLILYLDGLPRRTFARSLYAASVIAVCALFALVAASRDTSALSTFIGFSAAVVLWGWQEMAFLMGGVSGPRREACPPDASELQKFRFATEAILYHELALAACMVLIYVATWQQVNQIASQTFLLLWVMRLSAKLNLFLGVRNQYSNFLPSQLRYLASYFGKRPLNLLFPVSVTASSAMAFLLWQGAMASHATPHEIASFSLLATLLTLAVLEHWFLVLPLPVESIWRWALGSRAAAPPPTTKPVEA